MAQVLSPPANEIGIWGILVVNEIILAREREREVFLQVLPDCNKSIRGVKKNMWFEGRMAEDDLRHAHTPAHARAHTRAHTHTHIYIYGPHLISWADILHFWHFLPSFIVKNAPILQPTNCGCKFVFLFSSFSLLLPYFSFFPLLP